MSIDRTESIAGAKERTPTDKEKEAIEFLRNDSLPRIFIINKIAAPVLNKMLDCGMTRKGEGQS